MVFSFRSGAINEIISVSIVCMGMEDTISMEVRLGIREQIS